MDVVKSFDDIFLDCTSLGVKLKTEEYAVSGQYAIVDQGQHDIAGYTDRTEGVYADVPAIIFGDHTRVIKYIDQPLFLGADGVKLLKAKEESANYKYLYYALRSIRIPNTGYNRHFKWLKESQIEYPDAETQQKVVDTLDKVIGIITIRKQQLSDFDTLIKARFMELFGNPITREKDEELKALGDYCDLKAGKFVKASDIVENNVEGLYPCFGGNGQRGFVSDYTHDGDFPIIGRQGALCGNVQYASGKFHATEHAVVVTPRIEMDRYWLYYLLLQLNLNRYATGAAQPGLAVSNLEKIHVSVPKLSLQKKFADFARQSDKSKLAVQQSLEKTQELFDSLMQKYFG